MANTLLAGKTVIVTGGASGIGLATAKRFAAEGARVVIADLDAGRAKQAADDLAAAGAEAIAIPTDVSDSAAAVYLVEETERQLGAVHVLSHNAGLAGYPTPALEASEDEFERIMTVNVKGAWLCAKAVAPAIVKAGGGAIILVGSVMGERARPGFGAYASSKAATNHLARTLALEWAPDVRVNSVAPVATDTAMLPKFLGPTDPEGARKAFIAGIPLGRLAQPDDIADVTVFLASDQARFVTGVVLPVDGGRSV